MGWKATGQPTVRKQRDKWVVRVDGIDTATGKHRPRQLGHTRRSALPMAARSGAPTAAAPSAARSVGWCADPRGRSWLRQTVTAQGVVWHW